MKDKEKQIEEMAKVIIKGEIEKCGECPTCEYGKYGVDCLEYKRAEALLPLIKQYQEQAVKEYAKLLKEKAFLVPNAWCVDIKDIDETLKEVIGGKNDNT